MALLLHPLLLLLISVPLSASLPTLGVTANEQLKLQVPTATKDDPTATTNALTTTALVVSEPSHAVVRKIMFINLESRADRRLEMKQTLEPMGIPFARVPAVSGVSLQNPGKYADELKGKKYCPHLENAKPKLTQFITSVFLSHVTTYEQLAKEYSQDSDQNTPILVLEDDASKFVDNWQEILRGKLATAPDDWDVLRIGWWGKGSDEDQVPGHSDWRMARSHHVPSPNTPFVHWYFGAHAVLVRPRTIGRLLQHLQSSCMTDVDSLMVSCCTELKSYVLVSQLVLISESGSNTDHPPKAKKPQQ